MRDPNRIKPFLETLQILWGKNPDIRFHQLCWWIAGAKDRFNREDDETLQEIRRMIGLEK